MDFGYKSLIVTMVVCAAWCKTKASAVSNDKVKADSSVIENPPTENKLSLASKAYHIDNYKPSKRDFSEIDSLHTEDNDSLSNSEQQKDSTDIEHLSNSIKDLEYEAVRLITMSESLEMNAYYDNAAGKWTIGFGNITHPDGAPIKKGDKIKDVDELMFYFRSFFSEKVAPDIQEYLPTWDKFNRQEKLALLDMFWNAGSGKLHEKDSKKQSALAKALNAYAENRTPENLRLVTSAMKARQFISTKKKGIIPTLQKRVAFRIKIFTGEIQIGGTGPNSINLDEAHIGAHYGAFKPSDLYNLNFSPEKLETICDSINNCRFGRNFADTLQYKLENKQENKQRSMQSKQRARRQPQRRTTPQRKEFGGR